MRCLKNRVCLSKAEVGDILWICCYSPSNAMRYVRGRYDARTFSIGEERYNVRAFPILHIKNNGDYSDSNNKNFLVRSQTGSRENTYACGTLVKIEKRR